ncbi:MAG: RluA family pseudouridine synthase [Candidatus Krumholzibacteriota bacterium]
MTDKEKAERTFTVEPDDAGQRLDSFLVDRCPDISRNRIHADMKEERVRVDGRSRPKGYRLRDGNKVVFQPGTKPEMEAVPQDIPLDIIHEDDHLLVVDKSVGMVVHPAVGHADGTLVNALLHHCKNLSAGGDPLRPGIVHRLDRDTSGLMAVALTDTAHRHLAAQLMDRRMGRTYLALSWGRWKEDEGTLTGDIGRHPRFRQKMAVVASGGKSAVTRYRVLEDFGFVQLCEVQLETGRTHQIRVHFAHNGHPVVGDRMYGDDQRARGIHTLDRRLADRMVKAARRQLLHAMELKLVHPATSEPLEFRADVPPDMTDVLAMLREKP